MITLLVLRRMVDKPNERTLHAGAIPRGGGLIIVIVLCVGLIGVGLLSQRFQMFGGLLLVALFWAALSWWDDRHDLSPRVRLVIQVLLALSTVAAFGYVDQIQIGDNHAVELGTLGAIITFFGIIWFANLYNFMDGMDGLAGAQSVIAALTTGFWFWYAGDFAMALVLLLAAAASYGFLLLNWHPARIFMGDVGSVTLGAFFATIIVIGSNRYNIPVISFVLLFGVFIVDATVTLIRRIIRGEKFWLPHRTHYYQRLAALGFAHDKIVVSLIVLMLVCSLTASIGLLHRDIILPGAVFGLILLMACAGAVIMLENKSQNN